MARAKPTGDSKQGLIIALVIFVILSLVLGAMTYFGYSEQTTLDNQKKDAETKLANATKEREKLDYERRVYKHAIGIADPKEDDLAPLQAGHRAEFESLSKRLTGVTWNAGDAAPATNYVAAKTKLENDLKNSQAAEVAAKAELEKARNDHAEAMRLKEEELRKTKAALDTQAAQFAKLQGEKSKAYEETLNRIKDRDEEIDKLKNQVANTDATNKKGITKLEAQIKALQLQREKLADQIKPIDWEQLDQPKARIVQIERAGTTAYVDVGLADRVKAGLTFSVFTRGADGKRSSREPKGSVEIVEARRDHLSLAKITEVRNPTREPILTGDLLYNPAWSPNMREHVAIVGLIDLSGDGKDHTREFVQSLTKQGIIVDAYLDLKDQTLKNGEGETGKLTHSTTYLVQGEFPQFVESAAIDTAVGERKMAIHAKLADINKEADSLGITKIPVRRFLALIGYKVPRSAFTGDTSTFYSRPPKTSGETKEAKEKEEPKDDGDEPKKPPKKELPKKEPPKKEKPAPKGKDKPKEENPPKEDAPKDEKPPKEEKGE